MITDPESAFYGNCARVVEPRPRQNVWQWAEANRIISRGVSAKARQAPVRYKVATAPHQREPQEAVTDPDVEVTILIGASQIFGKTEIINNISGYYMHHHPSNQVIMYPTVESTERYSKRKWSPMARDTPVLNELLSPARSRDSGNTILVKEFMGGSVFFVGSNSAASLRQSSGELLIGDEIDSMEDTGEGDPIELLWARGESYETCTKVLSSTPTETGSSRIWGWFEKSDQRYWFVPCTKCGKYQQLVWGQVRWEKGKPQSACYVCAHCERNLTDKDRLDMYYAGEWRPTAEFKGIRGYHQNGIYCPWPAHKGFKNRLHEMAVKHLRIGKHEAEKRRVWVNTFLCETYEEEAVKPPSWSEIQARCETYSGNGKVPAGVLYITAGVDVQDDRLECLVGGWGVDEEFWGLEMIRIVGNPELAEPWDQLAKVLAQKLDHSNGHVLTIGATCLDSGHKPKLAYAFARRMFPLVYCTKGSSTPEAPLRGVPRKTTVKTARLILVGTNTAKDHIFSRLRIDKPGPRYMHFPIGCGFDQEFFEQLCSEKKVSHYRRGRSIGEYKKTRERNEALDLMVENMVALDLKQPIPWEALSKRLAKAEDSDDKKTRDLAQRAPGRGGWVSNWRR